MKNFYVKTNKCEKATKYVVKLFTKLGYKHVLRYYKGISYIRSSSNNISIGYGSELRDLVNAGYGHYKEISIPELEKLANVKKGTLVDKWRLLL